MTALEAAVIDTRAFQRLRYIRQNALLHFVFPGAVHTRFAHSIGTMAMAGRVWSQLLLQLDIRRSDPAVQYVGTVFRLGALLHDVGHCAFSHSSEHVKVDGKPLFGTLRDCLERWRDNELVNQLSQLRPQCLDRAAQHEEIGLALVRHLFRDEQVKQLCASQLHEKAENVARDVCAMMSGDLGVSPRWDKEARRFYKVVNQARTRGRVAGRIDSKTFSSDLLDILHSLVSGTIDVDRMDYLIRDSYYCGVPYGRCDVELLIGNLSIGGIDGRLELFLNRKAVDCLDDFLWSRYQLFVQVLNHKANVAMNTLLIDAIPAAMHDGHLDAPESMSDYLLFTDDQVMAAVTSACSRGKLRSRKYAKTLVDRRLPLHLGSQDDPGTPQSRERAKRKHAADAGVDVSKVFVGTAESILLKPGRFPSVLQWNRASSRFELHRYEDFSHFRYKGVPSMKRVLHYYVDRDDLSA